MLLAAGHGRRLGSLTDELPKPMLPIGGRPLIEHTVIQLASAGIREVMVNLHRRGDVIQAYFGDGQRFGLQIHYSHEPQLLGTAGAITKCREFFEDGPFFVLYGDNLTTCRLANLTAHHEERRGVGTIALFWRDDVSAHSSVEIQDDTRITKFVEKPLAAEASSRWISAGVIAFEPAVLSQIPSTVPCDIGFDVFPRLLASGQNLYGYYMTGDERLWWIDTPDHYRHTQELWRNGLPPG